METFLIKNRTRGMQPFFNQERQERNGTERPFFYSERNGTERERNDKKKEEQERNDLAEGPRSRTERNDFKKVGTCPALMKYRQQLIYQTRFSTAFDLKYVENTAV